MKGGNAIKVVKADVMHDQVLMLNPPVSFLRGVSNIYLRSLVQTRRKPTGS
jgi:hypothetical protein|eukprot:COSAG02_NODE_4335_length_5491_cov_14.768361_3_plen_51_part_00